jgi:hypothetical protein
MIHIVKKSGRENDSSVMYLILCVLVVMKNPTEECEYSKIMFLKARYL